MVVTTLNKYFITDFNKQWQLSMIAIAFYLVFYSLKEYYTSRSKVSLLIFVIFASELLAAVSGWNLRTEYYTEIILGLGFVAIFYFIKHIWQQRSNS